MRRAAASLVARAVRFRFLLLGVVAVVAAALSLTDTDWVPLFAGGQSLLGDAGLHTYARLTGLQAGPPSLLAIVGLDGVTRGHGLLAVHLLLIFAAPAALWMAERAGRRTRAWEHRERRSDPPALVVAPSLRCVLVGLLAVIAWGALAGGAHLDDGLAMLALGAALYAVAAGAPITAGALVGAAIAFKPWAIVGLPLVFGLARCRRNALLVAVVIPAACWLPFVFADHGTMGAGGRPFPISAAATIRLLGLHDPLAPAWLRSAELIAALTVALVAARRDGWPSAVPAGMLARLLLDPATLAYYTSSAVLACAMVDIQRQRVPWRTAVVWCGLWAAPVLGPANIAVPLRAGTLLVVVASYLGLRPHRSRRALLASAEAEATASETCLQMV